MDEKKRIVLNTCVTYGRTLIATILGLFSSRWILNALGHDDFGLLGVVGGIIVFITFLVGLLVGSISRYYAFAIGQMRVAKDESAKEELMHWFNAAFSIHIIIPVLCVCIGYPIGVYAIKNWFVIPVERVCACIWVFRFSLIAAFVNMISVPYIAMYTARQLIFELSLWSIVTTIANFIVAYYILSAGGDRLVKYSALITIVPSCIIGIQVFRAHYQFDACRIKIRYLFNRSYLRRIFAFAFWDCFGWLGGMVRDEGSVFVINRNFGAGLNASYSIANRVSAYATSLASALLAALSPAITSATGAGDSEYAKSMAHRACKISVILIGAFAIPLLIEMDEVLRLWLIDPPEFTAPLCRCVLLAILIQKLAWGYHMAIIAKGRIALFQTFLGLTAVLSLVILVMFIALGFGPISVGLMLIVIYTLMTFERVIFAKLLLGYSLRKWLFDLCVPVCGAMLASWFLGTFVAHCFSASLLRVVAVSVASIVVLLISCYFVALDRYERSYIKNILRNRIGHLCSCSLLGSRRDSID